MQIINRSAHKMFQGRLLQHVIYLKKVCDKKFLSIPKKYKF